MKFSKIIKIITITFLSVNLSSVFAQNISFIPDHTTLDDTLGSEMVFELELKNISAQEQTVFVVRTINNLPADWSSSLCFDFCYPNTTDSIVTNSTFGSSPLQPDEVRAVSIHVYPLNNIGMGNLQLQAGTMREPANRIIVDFTANTFEILSAEDNFSKTVSFELKQNYPNPFNNGTIISYQLEKAGNVKLKLYDILGNELMDLVNEFKSAGHHSYFLDASNLSSGVYFYKLESAGKIQTKKIVLEK